jgi:hypothetical protein
MDGSGGTPAPQQDSSAGLIRVATPPPPAPVLLLSLESLLNTNHPPSLIQNVFNVNPIVRTYDDNLQLMMLSQLESLITNTHDNFNYMVLPPLEPVAPAPSTDLAPPAPASPPPQTTAPAEPEVPAPAPPPIVPWVERCMTLPTQGTIRLLTPPPPAEGGASAATRALWDTDQTYSQWMARADGDPAVAAIFEANQRRRWLARTVWHRLTQRVWCRRTQCNVDMIDMAEVSDADAILVTDAAHRTVYRFHRRDLFNTLLSNICMSEEMLPNPRAPRNPWTNAPFTFGQIVGVCHSLLQDYARHGRCPPVLFSAFWAAQFDVRRFAAENASLLGQHAITAYFKDINDHNRDTVADTIIQLLTEAGIACTPVGVRRWLRASPLTAGHREWLRMASDYTLYMNLHVQVRAHWHTEDIIQHDVRRLHQRHPVSDAAGPRLRALRNLATPGPGSLEAPSEPMSNLLTLLFGPRTGPAPTTTPQDIDETIERIQNSLFGGRGSGGRG